MKRTSISVPEDLYERASDLAAKEDRSVSAVMRQALQHWVDWKDPVIEENRYPQFSVPTPDPQCNCTGCKLMRHHNLKLNDLYDTNTTHQAILALLEDGHLTEYVTPGSE